MLSHSADKNFLIILKIIKKEGPSADDAADGADRAGTRRKRGRPRKGEVVQPRGRGRPRKGEVVQRKQRKARTSSEVGKGSRHGNKMERALLCSLMRETKAKKKKSKQQETVKQLKHEVSFLASVRPTAGGNARARKVTFKHMTEMAFNPQSMNTIDVARSFKVSRPTVTRIWGFVARLYQTTQLQILKAISKRAESEKPDFMLTRVAWDETGERLTLSLPGAQDRHLIELSEAESFYKSIIYNIYNRIYARWGAK